MFNQAGEGDGDLVYRQDGLADGLKLRRPSTARGRDPVPVWVTRRTAGVRTLGELEGRDGILVAGTDPLSGGLHWRPWLPRGVTPKQGRRITGW